MANHPKTAQSLPILSQGLFTTIVSHTSFGLYVVLSKDLFSRFPPFGLLACSFSFALVVGSIVLHREFHWDDVLIGSLWLVAFVALLRSLTKMLAVQYTLATYVQLLGLMSPFFTAILARVFLSEELPQGTIPALLVSTAGALLVIVHNPLKMQLPNGQTDLIGLGLATASAVLMAMLVVITSFSTRQRSNPVNVYLQQTFTLAAAYLLLSVLFKESWEPFWQIDLAALGYLLVFFLVVSVGGGLTVFAISRINSTLFSTLLSLRLVVAIVAGWIILDEQFTSWFQVLGTLLVITAITWYLWRSKSNTPASLSTSSESSI